MTGYKEVKFKVSKLTYSRLKSCARQRGCTMSEVLRTSTIRYLNEYDESNKRL